MGIASRVKQGFGHVGELVASSRKWRIAAVVVGGLVLLGLVGGILNATRGTSSSGSAGSSSSSDAATSDANADIVGSWRATYIKLDDETYSESKLDTLEKSGSAPYLDIESDGTGLLTVGDKTVSYTWTSGGDGAWYLTAKNEGTSMRAEVKSGTLVLGGGVWKFKRIDPSSKVAYTGSGSSSSGSGSSGSDSGSSSGSSSGSGSGSSSSGSSNGSSSSNSGSSGSSSGEVTPSFKETMDSYEQFFDEYVEFMQTYQGSDDVAGMLSDYSDMLARYTETMKSLDAIDTSSLSAADYAYYIEVTGRISQKLLTVSGS